MTIPLANINIATDTFSVWVTKTNQLLHSLTNHVVTVDNISANVSIGNGFIVGTFGANTLAADTIRGGNTTTSGNLSISSNVTVAGSLTVSNNALFTGNINFDSNTLFIDSVNNRVGIGTGSPQYALDISGTSNTTTAIRIIDTDRGQAYLLLTEGANSGQIAEASGTLYLTNYALGSIGITQTGNRPVTISTDSVIRLYVSGNGNIGIGNSTPKHKLRVGGDISLSGGIHANGSFGTAGQILLTNGSSSYWATEALSNGSSTNTFTVGTSVYFVANGNVGFGTVGPNTKLEVNGNALVSGSLTGGSLISSSNTMTVGTATYFVANGNVGIGNSTPSVKFVIESTDAFKVPVGTEAQRPTGNVGFMRFNSNTNSFEGYNGTAWGSIGGGATGGGNDRIFHENDQVVTANYTITTNKNAGTFGPITIDSGVTVTVPTGSTWSII